MKVHLRLIASFLLQISFWSLPHLLLAQSGANTGQIVGQVIDQSGSSVAGAEVTVRNRDTNFSRNISTDSVGRYAASYLPLGRYEVTVNASGFQTPSQDAFVTLGSSVSTKFNLLVAGKTESIEITTGTPGIEPTRAAPKSILTELQIRELPSN